MQHSGSTNVLSVAVNTLRRGCLLSGRREKAYKTLNKCGFYCICWQIRDIFHEQLLNGFWKTASSVPSDCPEMHFRSKVRMSLPHDGWSSPSENLESFISVVKLIFKSIFHKRAAPRWRISSFHQRCCCFSHCKFCIWWWWWCGDCACKQG